jgi:hypothetical protein
MRFAVAATLLAALALTLARADDKSCPEVGAAPSSFDVVDVTGPNKGKTVCYV